MFCFLLIMTKEIIKAIYSEKEISHGFQRAFLIAVLRQEGDKGKE